MLRVTQRLNGVGQNPDRVIVLPFDLRQRSRLLCQDTRGNEIALFLSRGAILRHGDLLQAENGEVIAIEAAPETVSVVTSDDAYALSRAAYHLGNRHVPLEIAPKRLAYLHDHVLDDMVRHVGLQVHTEDARFEPEPGAYGAHTHHHHDDHHHDALADHHHDALADHHHHDDHHHDALADHHHGDDYHHHDDHDDSRIHKF